MITTLFFLLLAAFLLWYQASGQVRKTQPAGPVGYAARYPRPARLAGLGLALASAALLVARLGWMTGLCAWVVGLMGVGCLVVAVAPFRYLGPLGLGGLYLVFLAAETLL